MTAQTKALLAPKIQTSKHVLWFYFLTFLSVEIIRHIANR